MSKKVIVLVSDNGYLSKLFDTVRLIRTIGNYHEDIVVLPHPDLKDHQELLQNSKEYNYELKFFDLIDISHILQKIRERPFSETDGRQFTKTFQWHKMHLFQAYFKKWDIVFYMDIGMKIFKDINIFFSFAEEGKLIAHCDDYPEYKSCLSNQIDKDSYPILRGELHNLINLNRRAFQSGVLIFKTTLIEEDTYNILIDLANKYHISKTNEQGVMNIYFNGLNNIWKELPVYYENTFTYDFWERGTYSWRSYIMLKYPRTL